MSNIPTPPMSIIPAVIPSSKDALLATARLVAPFAHTLQIDVTDGAFVQSMSWPFTEHSPNALSEACMQLSEDFPHLALEVDAMVREPEKYIESWIASGVERVVIHIESSENIDALLSLPRRGALVGLALGNDTPLETLDPHISNIDFVQCMGIATIGVQGEPFDERVIDRISSLHDKYPDLQLSVDGSVNEHTIERLRNAGVTHCVVGSAILKSEHPQVAYEHLLTLLLRR